MEEPNNYFTFDWLMNTATVFIAKMVAKCYLLWFSCPNPSVQCATVVSWLYNIMTMDYELIHNKRIFT